MYKLTTIDVYHNGETQVFKVRQNPAIIKQSIEDIDDWQTRVQSILSTKLKVPIQVFANFKRITTRNLNTPYKNKRVKRLRHKHLNSK